MLVREDGLQLLEVHALQDAQQHAADAHAAARRVRVVEEPHLQCTQIRKATDLVF